ncbi:sensor histidine kinase [Parapedobacter koreensis]|uniref:histidine kinase n=1 Tax=Parapedobacter koreensis TaxID=332977 RepID=A0A1H7JBD0_9SPHI|nr:HAMP domain-containing sensor histidine kinase [Parapedobacter koreensis]SEK71310.1 two-component system, OmpR family, phosphate regulon sensor histidine kinase PhoR [Parapedobacter koreensis]
MKYSLAIHKGISLLGLVLLIAVLFYLTYNAFKLRDEQYQAAEKTLINNRYTQRIRNDKVFPGGVAIIDPYLMGNMYTMEVLYDQDRVAFEHYKNRILDSMFHALRETNTMDRLFAQIKAEYTLNEDLQYLLTINSIQLVFKNLRVVTIYQADESYPFIPDSLKTRYGVYIGGKLGKPRPQNQIAGITVSSPTDYNYWMTFSLYADHSNRTWHIVKLMMPTFLLALFAIGCVVSIYYITFRNWIRQKKLAEMKSDFVNSITHEFNTPLSTIIVANKNMQNDKILADPNNIKPLTKIIERQSLRLQKLFEQVMDITTMDNSSLQKEAYELNQLLYEIITDYNVKASVQHIAIELNEVKQPFVVELNRFFFTTMLFNLFDNAIKYNHNDHKRITVTIEIADAAIHLQIADNGIGIPDQEIEHIFEKFYRIQKQGTQHIAGLGLGLYYTYQCIKSHGWTLSVTSEEMKGSQFTINIPY